MNAIRINDKTYKVPGDGIGYSSDALQVSFFADGMTVDNLKEALPSFNGSFDLYDKDGNELVASYNGYTVLESIRTEFNVTEDDSTTADLITFVMRKPSLQETVNQNTADITAINDAIASLAEIVGGE